MQCKTYNLQFTVKNVYIIKLDTIHGILGPRKIYGNVTPWKTEVASGYTLNIEAGMAQ
jgi:hypothetical protein